MATKTMSNGHAELQNGQEQRFGRWDEIGSSGLQAYSGFITKAYVSELFWPSAEPIYSRIWRSDPEVTIVRHLFSAWAGKLSPEWIVPEVKGPDGEPLPPSDDDRAAAYFANTAMEDIDGGIDGWLTSAITRVPFFGFGYWESVPGLRREGWQAPGGKDPWQSQYDDGLVGIRRLAFRDYSSFMRWEMDDYSGRVQGLEQHDPPNPPRIIPLDRALHIRYGDLDNPEGLGTLEAIYRLERIKYGLEVIQGIGFEHAAGHAVFSIQGPLDAEAKATLRRAGRALMAAAEGNYVTELLDNEGNHVFKARIEDVPFQAGPALLEAIRYYGILKLGLFGMQFVALSSLSGAGSFAAMNDASEMALMMFNNTAGGIIKQADEQLGQQLFGNPVNAAAFPGMTRRPRLTINELEKPIPMAELGAFVQAISAVMPLGEDDLLTIREKSNGVLSETLPEEEMEQPQQEPQDEVDEDMPDGDTPDVDETAEVPEADMAQLAQRLVLLPDDEEPVTVQGMADNPAAEAERVVRRFRRWATDNAPELARLLDAEVTDDDES